MQAVAGHHDPVNAMERPGSSAFSNSAENQSPFNISHLNGPGRPKLQLKDISPSRLSSASRSSSHSSSRTATTTGGTPAISPQTEIELTTFSSNSTDATTPPDEKSSTDLSSLPLLGKRSPSQISSSSSQSRDFVGYNRQRPNDDRTDNTESGFCHSSATVPLLKQPPQNNPSVLQQRRRGTLPTARVDQHGLSHHHEQHHSRQPGGLLPSVITTNDAKSEEEEGGGGGEENQSSGPKGRRSLDGHHHQKLKEHSDRSIIPTTPIVLMGDRAQRRGRAGSVGGGFAVDGDRPSDRDGWETLWW